jgi:hypothetical protein
MGGVGMVTKSEWILFFEVYSCGTKIASPKYLPTIYNILNRSPRFLGLTFGLIKPIEKRF